MLFEEVSQLLVDGCLDEASDFGICESHFCLCLEVGVGEFDGHDGGQALAQVVAGCGLAVLDEVVRFCVVVHCSCQGGPEAGKVCPAVDVSDVVGEDEDVFRVSVVVLHCYLAAQHGLGVFS